MGLIAAPVAVFHLRQARDMARGRWGDTEMAHEREGDLDLRWDPGPAGCVGANSASADAEEAAGSPWSITEC